MMKSNTPSQPTIKAVRLDFDAGRRTLVFVSHNEQLPDVIYCGVGLSEHEDLPALMRNGSFPLTPGTLDQLSPLSVLPEEGRGFLGQPGLRVTDAKGRPALTQFAVTNVRQFDSGVEFQAHDAVTGLSVAIAFVARGQGAVLSTRCVLTNNSEIDWRVEWLSTPALPVDQDLTHILEYQGRWTNEFDPVTVPLSRSVLARTSKRGRTGHDHFPAMVFCDGKLRHTYGPVSAVHFTYSHVHRMLLEELPDGRRQVQCGIAEPRWLKPTDSTDSGEALWVFSTTGANTLMHSFHAYVREHLMRLPDPTRERPVHYNSWEAVYFDHNVDELKDLASRAAALGAERFVLDDGWFGGSPVSRNDDTTTLGDWFVDSVKYPDDLTPLVQHVKSLGMTFGIWLEPEMVNLNSALARQHPDWVMAHGNADQPLGRQQHVLDLTIPQVVDYLFSCIDSLLQNNDIDYLKWDMNRDITRPIDAAGVPLLVRQSEALYGLFKRIRDSHPHVEIESCASGGGRIDYRILELTHRVWLSDSNDAHVRWRMQQHAALFLPPEIMGSHVGPRHCHTSGRALSMSFRALVAMTGHMGMEMDLRELNVAESETLKRTINWYKTHRSWMHQARCYRLDSREPACFAQLFVASDQKRFLLFVGTLDVPRFETTSAIRLAGLAENITYRVNLLNADDIAPLATRRFSHPTLDTDGVCLSGCALMHAGIVPPFPMPDTLFLYSGSAVS